MVFYLTLGLCTNPNVDNKGKKLQYAIKAWHHLKGSHSASLLVPAGVYNLQCQIKTSMGSITQYDATIIANWMSLLQVNTFPS